MFFVLFQLRRSSRSSESTPTAATLESNSVQDKGNNQGLCWVLTQQDKDTSGWGKNSLWPSPVPHFWVWITHTNSREVRFELSLTCATDILGYKLRNQELAICFQEQQTIATQNVKMLLTLTASRQVKGMTWSIQTSDLRQRTSFRRTLLVHTTHRSLCQWLHAPQFMRNLILSARGLW
jgi:hypothetical protein